MPRSLLPDLVPSGTRLGPLLPEIARETGLGPVEVVASCSHDTGAAVAAVPASGGHWAYISSGTWSLMGIECARPVLTDSCRQLNFTNEIGYGNSVRLLKNIIGLWLVQECRRHWAGLGRDFHYQDLMHKAAGVRPFQFLIDPTDARFVAPDGMPCKMADFCRETGQPEPRTEGEFVRCALESLALLYRQTARELESLTGRGLERVHIVGGGSRNELLNQFAANALGVPVVAGPVEATAAGNILVQALAVGVLGGLDEARGIIRDSYSVRTFEPCDRSDWERAAMRFESLRHR